LLKTRKFVPETLSKLLFFREPEHVIIQFVGQPQQKTLDALASKGVRILGYIPRNAVISCIPADTNLSSIPGIRWIGAMYPSDKVSSHLKMSLDKGFVLVDVFPDVTQEEAEKFIKAAGGKVLENPYLLSSTFLVRGNGDVVNRLSRIDMVSWIWPASDTIINGLPVHACPGPITTFGPMGNYVANDDGWDGPGQGSAHDLKYHFENGTPDISGNLEESEVERGLNEWTNYAEITWTRTATVDQNRAMDISWLAGEHGDGIPFDGAGDVLAHCFYPSNLEPIAADMHFDEDEAWGIGSNTDVFSVALHESGHGLGLGHSDNTNAVMYAYYSLVTGLNQDDIDGIRSIYAFVETCSEAYEPNNNSGQAVTLLPGQAQTHSICPVADEDWLTFTLTTHSAVLLETYGTIGDTIMWLYDSNLNQIESNDDNGTGAFSKIDRLCGIDALSNATYYVKVDEYGDNDVIGNYDISLTVVACSSDTVLPTTTTAPAGGTYNTAQTVALTCTDTGGSGCATTYYCLGDGCNPTMVYSNPIDISTTTALRFYSVDSARNNETAQTENYVFTEACSAAYEPNNNATQAVTLLAGQAQTHSICPAGDEDWVTFTLTSPSAILLETSGVSGDTIMWLYDSSLNQIEYNDDNGIGAFSKIDRLCVIDELPSGTYYVNIDEYGGNDTIDSYDISLTVVECSHDITSPTTTAAPAGGAYNTAQTVELTCTDTGGAGCATTYYCLGNGCNPTMVYSSPINISSATALRFYSVDGAGNSETVKTENYVFSENCSEAYEPDNDFGQAVTLLSGQAQTHSICPSGDEDWVTFSITSPSAALLEISGGAGNTRMWLYDTNLTQIEYNDDGGTGNFSKIDRLCGTGKLPNGTYYVKVNEYGDNHVIDDYYISLTIAACSTDTILPTTAAAPAGGAYDTARTVELTCTDTDGSGCATTYYCLGSGCNPTTIYSNPIDISSTTALRFYSVDGNENNETVQNENYIFSGSCFDIYEPNNNSSQAVTLLAGQIQTHSICPAADGDWLTFTLTSSSAIVLETSGSDGDIGMWLYDSNLTQIEYNDDGGTGSFSKIDRLCGTDELPNGTYYVKLDEYSGNAIIDSYDISLTVTLCHNEEVQITPIGNEVELLFHKTKVAITFNDVTLAGETTVKTLPNGSGNLSGFEVLGNYYTITTTAQFNGNMGFCFIYSPEGLTSEQEQNLEIMHYKNGEWQVSSASVNTNTKTICGITTGFLECAIVYPPLAASDDVPALTEYGMSLMSMLLLAGFWKKIKPSKNYTNSKKSTWKLL